MKFKIGDKIQETFGSQIMTVKDFEPGFVENVITEYTDPDGNIITAKFMDAGLKHADSE